MRIDPLIDNAAHPPTAQLLNRFPEYNSDDVICECLHIKRNEILPLINKSTCINKLVSCTGAGSVCTGCHPLLDEILGNDVWIKVQISAVQQVSKNTKTIRFKSLCKPFEKPQSGQHILLQAYINGSWHLRRYTLTSPANQTAYREITVQCEPGGLVSNWLFNSLALNEPQGCEKHIRISQAMGEICFDFNKSKSLICLVAGIGVTPAISAIRTLCAKDQEENDCNIWKNISQQISQNTGEVNNHQAKRRLHIDYSTQNTCRLVYANELDDYQKQHENITVHLRITNQEGFITESDIAKLVQENPQAEYFVCGPQSYIQTVTKYLHKLHVSPDNISIERFSVPLAETLNLSRNYFYMGLILVALFILQEMLQLKMAWLETFQSNENYKIYSGLGLLVYMGFQFVLPYNKSCENPHVSAKCYNRHKLRGALSPLVFYLHSTHFGATYLFVLSSVFFSNIVIGFFNHERIKNPLKRIRYFKRWLPLHIIVSLSLIALSAFHVFVVAAY